nr:reverse transcriptase domain-containing protein [Tanacetum cinerariifolium]
MVQRPKLYTKVKSDFGQPSSGSPFRPPFTNRNELVDHPIERTFGLRPCHFTYSERRLTMEEMLNKFIDEGKRVQEKVRAFIHDFRTTNELLFKERNNSLVISEEIAKKFPDEHLMILKTQLNKDEPWYGDYVNYIVGKIMPHALLEMKSMKSWHIVIMDQLGGHHSASITERKVYEARFFCPSIFKNAKDYIIRCDAKEIAKKFPDEHLMILKTQLNKDEPWYGDYVNYIVGKIMPHALLEMKSMKSWHIVIMDQLGGHHSASITERKVYEAIFFCPSIFKDAKDYIIRCDASKRSGNISSRSEMAQNNI